MKVQYNLAILITSLVFSGCATNQNGIALDLVGPPPLVMTTSSTSTNGTLLVYSAFRRNADFNSRNPYLREYSDYEIFTTDGKLVQKVHNNSGTSIPDAVSVKLPVGTYDVKARANGYGLVTIPVIIKPDQNTLLHLEGGGFWPDESAFNETNAVRLPDGLIIGWKSNLSTQ